MSLENIQLPAALIADLYKDSLVLLEDDQQKTKNAAPMPSSAGLPFLGNNKQQVIILVKEPVAPYINDESLNFLTKVLQAVGLSMADVAILNAQQQNISFNDLQKQLKAQKVMLFNMPTHEIGLPIVFPHFQVQSHAGCMYMCAPSLSQIENDIPTKKQFWAGLQKMFGK
jgi:hypothetical protein